MKKDFKQAIKWLKEGKKVRRPMWGKDSYWCFAIDEMISWKDGVAAHVHLRQIEANDWEIYKKIIPKPANVNIKFAKTKDLLEEIKIRIEN